MEMGIEKGVVDTWGGDREHREGGGVEGRGGEGTWNIFSEKLVGCFDNIILVWSSVVWIYCTHSDISFRHVTLCHRQTIKYSGP